MPETVKIAEYIPPRETKSGKWTPHKAKDGNGRVFTFGKEVAIVIKEHLGQSLEVEYSPKNSFDEYPLTSAKVPEPPKAQPSGNGGWGKSPDEAARICRQNALTNAVAYWGSAATLAKILDTAQLFAKWNLDGIVQMIEVGIPAAEQKAQPSPRRFTTGLREGEDLVTAARRAVEDHDPFEDELATIPPADAVEFEGPSVRHPIPAARETLRASGPARR